MTKAEKSEDDLVAEMLTAAAELEERGWSRTKLYNTLREQLPHQRYEDYLKSKDIRDITVFLRYLNGQSVDSLKVRYGVKSWNPKTICFNGFRKIGKIIPVNGPPGSPMRRYPLSMEAQAYWAAKAKEALKVLERELKVD
jgi:hypothetical protein